MFQEKDYLFLVVLVIYSIHILEFSIFDMFHNIFERHDCAMNLVGTCYSHLIFWNTKVFIYCTHLEIYKQI
jgi:hypothetical protein